MLSNLLSVLLAPLCLANASGATGLNKDTLPFENKVIYNLQEETFATNSNYYSGNGGPTEVSVVLQFSETFFCKHKEMDNFEEVLEHRQELKSYYYQYNSNLVDFLNLTDSNKVVVSSYGPFIEYFYDSIEDFNKEDYQILSSTNPVLLEKVYIEQENKEEYGAVPYTTRNPEQYEAELYPFSRALSDVGIPEEKPFTGNGIKIGSIDGGIPSNYAYLTGVDYEVYGVCRSEHSFFTASIFGGTSGIANNAMLYFTSMEDHSFFENADWLINKGVNIINCSYGWFTYAYGSISAYADYLVNKTKITFVSGAGNDGKKGCIEPATGVNTISVASNDSNLGISSFSSAGIQSQYKRSLVNPTLTAPGNKLTDIANIKGNMNICGTSYSTPFVTGIVAMLMEEFPILKSHPEQVIALLTNSCTKALGQVDTYDPDAGFGIVNYELARKNYGHTAYFEIDKDLSVCAPVFDTYIKLDFDDKLYAKTFVLLNRNKDSTEYVNLGYSDITIRICNQKTGELIYGDTISNFGYIEFTNTTYLYSEQTTTIFKLEAYMLNKNKNNYENELCAMSYSIEKYSDTHNFEDCLSISYDKVITWFNVPEDFNGHLIIPNWVTGIARSAFDSCKDLTCVTFEEDSKLELIDEFAIFNCSNLRCFIIPNSVTTIKAGAFAFSENVAIYTSLLKARSGWVSLWNLKKVDYIQMGNDIRNGTVHEDEYYYTYHTIFWGVSF